MAPETLHLSTLLVQIYPEQNLFDVDPPLHQLTPAAPSVEHDTPEFCAAARAITQSTGQNPLAMCYGSNPFIITDFRGISVSSPSPSLQFPQYERPPPLPQAVLPGGMVFLERIHPTGTMPLFTVRVGADVRLLKVFPHREPSRIGYERDEVPAHPLRRFATEKCAYEHLVHYGACANGAVPQCYGWLELSAHDMEGIANLPGIADELKTLATDAGPPKALLLEYFDGAVPVTIANVTEAIADKALRGLCLVHACYTLHDDINSRNILVTPSGRVVWVDFDAAFMVRCSTQYDQMYRYMFLKEMFIGWAYFYTALLPDKRIGYRSLLMTA